MKFLTTALIIFAIFLFCSCDEGLSPGSGITIEPGFSGKIIFKGDWPQDIQTTYIVLFKDSLKSSADFNALNLKYVSTEIPEGTKEFEFNTLTDISFGLVESGKYAYLAVAQSTSPVLSLVRSAWRVAGIYEEGSGQLPSGMIVIPENKFLSNVEITCDFDNPPAQPPN